MKVNKLMIKTALGVVLAFGTVNLESAQASQQQIDSATNPHVLRGYAHGHRLNAARADMQAWDANFGDDVKQIGQKKLAESFAAVQAEMKAELKAGIDKWFDDTDNMWDAAHAIGGAKTWAQVRGELNHEIDAVAVPLVGALPGGAWPATINGKNFLKIYEVLQAPIVAALIAKINAAHGGNGAIMVAPTKGGFGQPLTKSPVDGTKNNVRDAILNDIILG